MKYTVTLYNNINFQYILLTCSEDCDVPAQSDLKRHNGRHHSEPTIKNVSARGNKINNSIQNTGLMY